MALDSYACLMLRIEPIFLLRECTLKSCSRCTLLYFQKCPNLEKLEKIFNESKDFIDLEMKFRQIAKDCEHYLEIISVIYKTPKVVQTIYT